MKNIPEMKMENRPIPVLIVAILFILTGCIGFIYHFTEVFEPIDNFYELILVLILRIVAVVCGFLLFKGIIWARWIAIAWLLYHVFLSAFHSASELIMHIVLLILVAVLLYLPLSTEYFKVKSDHK
jgi:hypothetical protein